MNLVKDEKIKARIKKYTKRFEAADQNKDGKLDLDEFVAFQHLNRTSSLACTMCS